MRESELTPEDRLLKIIETPSVTKGGKGEFRAASGRRETRNLFSRLAVWGQGTRKISFHTVNKAMLVLCGLMTVLCVVVFRNSQVSFDNKFNEMSTATAEPSVAGVVTSPRDINFQQTLAIAKDHNIYTLDHASASSGGVMVGESQETANLKLVGIMWSDKPQAMVEDIIEHKTYLLNVGDQVGRLTVRSILKEKVILGREDHIWELR